MLTNSFEELERQLVGLTAFTHERVIGSTHVINPLLSVWEAAQEISPAVSAPVEALLTAAVHRSLIESQELLDLIEEVRMVAAQEALLARLVTS